MAILKSVRSKIFKGQDLTNMPFKNLKSEKR